MSMAQPSSPALPWGCQPHLAEGAVPGHGAQGQDAVGPLGQPVVDGHQNHVLEQLREDEQRQEQDAGRRQILGAGSPRDFGTLVQHRRQVVLLLTLGCLLCRPQKPTLWLRISYPSEGKSGSMLSPLTDGKTEVHGKERI